jgi:hypothetical protein
MLNLLETIARFYTSAKTVAELVITVLVLLWLFGAFR